MAGVGGEISGRLTALLQQWRGGDEVARDQLMELVYPELHQLAVKSLAGERSSHTLQPTALVNEAYLRLAGSKVPWSDRVHFFAIAARVMRRVLVDHAKSRLRAKRGGGAVRVTLEEPMAASPPRNLDVLAVEDALERLCRQDERKGRAVELHVYGGLTYDEVAHALKVSPATVKRELRFARAWLAAELAPAADESSLEA